MKRIIIVLILLSLTICLPACSEKENPEFARFNEMFDGSFETYKITVSSTSVSGQTVNNEYMITTMDGERRVSYKTEKLNEFIVDGDVIEIPTEYMTYEEGTYDAERSASSEFDIPDFNFSITCLSNPSISQNELSADITSLSDFMGIDVDAKTASCTVSYSGAYVNSIEISYVTEESVTVVITYTIY